MWVSLTRVNGDFEYINMNQCCRMYLSEFNNESVTKIHTDLGSILVKETPELIIDLMRQERERQR